MEFHGDRWRAAMENELGQFTLAENFEVKRELVELARMDLEEKKEHPEVKREIAELSFWLTFD